MSENARAGGAERVTAEAGTACELSVVMPCLNEADTLATCIRKAQQALRENGIAGEVVVADNGSSDGSREIAAGLGVRVVEVRERGYGHALMAGIAAARGTYVLMGDADDSYDFLELPKFLAKLREGNALVQGCRLPAGGGRVLPGAMPALHRHFGNPLLSALARTMFRVPVHDIYCGLRGFTKALYAQLDLRCTGMEFATEMIIKASGSGQRIAEVPITLHPDGRKSHPPHLRTFRDGWRTIRLFLLYSPRWLFVVPGVLLLFLGALGYALAMPGLRVFGAVLDAHTLLFASLALLLGYQSLLFGLFAKVFAIGEGLLPHDPRLERFFSLLTLERGLVAGLLMMLCGAFALGGAVYQWWAAQFGPLNYAHTMRWVIPGVTLVALGFQTILGMCFVSLLAMRRK